MSNIKKRFGMLTGLVLVLVLLISAMSPALVGAWTTYPLLPTDTEIADARGYLRSQQDNDGNIGGFGQSAWVTMAIAAIGEDPHNWKVGNNPSIVDYLAANAGEAANATDFARMILAAVAAHENPTNFGGIDFVAQLVAQYDGVQIGDPNLVNDDFWGVMALIAAGVAPDSEMIQNCLTFIKGCQKADGGWGFDVEATWGTDVDDTAAAIMALIAGGESPDSIAITNGLAFIKSTQAANGGFLSWGATNADTNSWGILAIKAAGQDPTSMDWTENGNTPVDDLLHFQQDNGQFFWQDGDPGAWPCQTTAGAIRALLGKPYPIIEWSFSATEYPAALMRVYPGDATVNLDTITEVPTEILGVFAETEGVWSWFIPAWTPAENTLHELMPGRPYLIQVSGACNWMIV